MATKKKEAAPPATAPKSSAEAAADRLDATERLLAMHKVRHAQALAAGDEDLEVTSLAAISKLEMQLESRRAFARVKAITMAGA